MLSGRFQLDRAGGSLQVHFDGRLHNRAWLRTELRTAADTDARLVEFAYRRWGHQLARQLEGDFSLAVLDPEPQCALLVRDAVGVRPLYYATGQQVLHFGSLLSPLVDLLDAPPDLAAAARFLIAPDSLAPSETFRRGIRALPPGHQLIFDRAGVRLEQYWSAPPGSYATISWPECVEEFRRLFRQSIRRRCADERRIGVLVSGGLDSSSIYACAVQEGADVIGIYHGAADGSAADETSYITALEGMGRPIERVPILPTGYPDLSSASVRASEIPLADQLAGMSNRVALRAAECRVTTLLNGTWADQVLFPFPPGYYEDCLKSGRWLTLVHHLRTVPRWFEDVPPGQLFRAAAGRLLRAVAPPALLRLRSRRRMGSSIARCLHDSVRPTCTASAVLPRWGACRSAHASSVERNIWSRADTLILEWYAKAAAPYGFSPAFPFLDRELLTLLVCVPGWRQVEGGVPKALLRAALRGILPDSILNRRNKGDYTDLVMHAQRTGAAQVFQSLKTGRALESDFLNASLFTGDLAYLRQRLDIREQDAAAALAPLYAVECWLRL